MRLHAPVRTASLYPPGLCALALALSAATLCAQDLGGLPRLDWRILRSDSVDVITAPATLPFARRALAIDEALIELRPLRLGERVVPIDVVVQPTTVVSNGFVGQTPWRSYLFATPPQQQDLISSADWTDLLAIHEYRHVEQNSALLRGYTRSARLLFGNGGWAAATGLSTPNWFFEGDATYLETVLTGAGRGRTPAFTALQRALALDSVRYPYQVARNGSFRRRVPDQYPLGVALVNHGRQVHDDPWPAVVRTAGNFWPPFYPFSVGLERATGMRTPSFYHAAYDSLEAVWRAEAIAKPLTPATRLTPLGRQLPTYSHPQPDPTRDDGSVVVARRSQVRIPQLVRLRPDGSEEALSPVGLNLDGAFHVAGGRATWSRLRFAERRPNVTYADIYVADYGTGGPARRLTRNARLFSPGLSPDGRRVIAVERELVPGRSRVVELDADSGTELRRVRLDADLVAAPRYTPADDFVALVKRDGWSALHRIGFGGEVRALTPWTRHTIGTPFVAGDRVYFSASFTGTDNVFSVALDGTGGIIQLTEVPVGAYGPSVRGDRLYFTEVDRRGDPVSVLAAAQWLNRPLAEVTEPEDLPRYAPYRPEGAARRFRENLEPPRPTGPARVLLPGGLPGDTTLVDADAGAPYNSLLRGFQIHTIQPLTDNVEASLTLLGENVLSDVQAEATVAYNFAEDRYRVIGDVTVAKTWPWVRLSLGQLARNYNAVDLDSLAEGRLRLPQRTFDEQALGLRLVAPLRQAAGAYNYLLRPELGARALRFSDVDADTERALDGDGLVAVDFRIVAQRTRFTAPKQLGPREGQLLDLSYQRGVEGDAARQLRVTVGQYLPGLHRSHNALVRLHYRAESTLNQYQFSDRFFYARGYDRLFSDATLTASLDYGLPLLYPDLGAAGIVYCRRIRANLFADVTQYRYGERFDFAPDDPNEVNPDPIASVGVDLTADLTFFNAQALPVGVRLAYRLSDDFLGANRRGLAEPQLLLALPL